MSIPNPPGAKMRRAYRRYSDEQIWREFYLVCLPVVGDKITGRDLDAVEAAKHADAAYAEYRKRFPVPPAALEPEIDLEESTGQQKEGIQ